MKFNSLRLVTLFLLMASSPLVGQKAEWPTRGWLTSTPEAQGIDSKQLATIFDAVKQRNIPIHSLLMVRNGRLVLDATFAPYIAGTVHDLASVTKSITSTLIGIAIDKGYIKSVDAPVLGFFPERTFANTDSRKRALTVRHLLTMTSGLCTDFRSGEAQNENVRRSNDWVQAILDAPLVTDPGSQFAYCSAASNLLSAILTRATGMSAEEFAKRHLFAPLGIKTYIWPGDGHGISNGWGDCFLLPHDMAKIGYLFLNNGVWEGKQIVSAAWVREATKQHVQTGTDEAYGYKWWIIPSLRLFEGRGRGGQRISILSARNLVVVLNGTGDFEPGDIGALLLPALKSDSPLPENPEAYDELQRRISEAAKLPAPQQAPVPPDMARTISGKTITWLSNTIGLRTLQFEFTSSDSGTMRYTYYDSLIHEDGNYRLTFGLDGAYCISNGSRFHLPVAARGSWRNDTQFYLETHMAGNNHLYRWTFDFLRTKVQLRISDEGLSEAALQATIE
ncbi:MAG: serine hydrolase [Ignavibacteria bacterium]|nr:serine hydrolase [Ignavibacteria bacterium]